jgi:hypothetical protein
LLSLFFLLNTDVSNLARRIKSSKKENRSTTDREVALEGHKLQKEAKIGIRGGYNHFSPFFTFYHSLDCCGAADDT